MYNESHAPNQLRRRIDRALSAGATIDAVEKKIINQLRISRDDRDALWLYSWARISASRGGSVSHRSEVALKAVA